MIFTCIDLVSRSCVERHRGRGWTFLDESTIEDFNFYHDIKERECTILLFSSIPLSDTESSHQNTCQVVELFELQN